MATGRDAIALLRPIPVIDHVLLDPPAITAARFADLERQVAEVLGTRNDVVLVQAEAILALEAIARGVGAPGRVCLNVVTGPYGALFGAWLASAGSEVVELAVALQRPVAVDEVAAALAARPDISVLAVVHAEAATGTVNPLADIAELARAHGALTIVDAVASAGAEPLGVDELGLDFCVIGPQKGWGGPAGVSIATISESGWAALREGPAPWRSSSLSLLDWKERWIDAGRTAIPATPVVLELLALEAACARLSAEGVPASIERHRRVAAAARAGVRGLGAALWVEDDADASALVTTVRVPDGGDSAAIAQHASRAYGATLTPGPGALRSELIRIDHMGAGARPDVVLAAVAALGATLVDFGEAADPGAGIAAVLASLRER